MKKQKHSRAEFQGQQSAGVRGLFSMKSTPQNNPFPSNNQDLCYGCTRSTRYSADQFSTQKYNLNLIKKIDILSSGVQ
jgi:hypothetical protein